MEEDEGKTRYLNFKRREIAPILVEWEEGAGRLREFLT